MSARKTARELAQSAVIWMTPGPFKLKFRAAYVDRRTMKPNHELETLSDEAVIADRDLAEQSPITADLSAWTVGETIEPLSPIRSSDRAPYNIAMTAQAETLDLPIPFIPETSEYENDRRKLSSYARELDIPVVYPVRDLGIQNAFQKMADWVISQREYTLEWIAFAAAVYACVYVFNGLIQALPHLPFKP